MKLSKQRRLSANSTGHLHISFYPKTNDYVIAISRKNKNFYMRTTTLEEAIKVRNKVYSFYERQGRFPNREELGIQRRPSRSKLKRVRTEDTTCSICGNKYDFSRFSRYQEFLEEGKICGYCKRRQNRDNSISVDNATGILQEKYITFDRTYANSTRYRVCITKHRQYFAKSYDTLEEAIKIRDQVVDFHNKHDRLPNTQEQEELFGIKSKPRESRNEKNETSSVSNTSMRNITFDKNCDRYFIQISRNRRRFSTSSKTLEDAISVRNAVIEFFKEHGHLPTNTEFRSFRKEIENV